MKLYAESIGRIGVMVKNNRFIHRREINDYSIRHAVQGPSCYLRDQYASQSGDFDDADSLAFLHELFENK